MDALLHAYLAVEQLLLLLLQLFSLSLEIDRLVRDLSGVAASPYSLPLDAVPGFLLHQPNTFQHVSDVINRRFWLMARVSRA